MKLEAFDQKKDFLYDILLRFKQAKIIMVFDVAFAINKNSSP